MQLNYIGTICVLLFCGDVLLAVQPNSLQLKLNKQQKKHDEKFFYTSLHGFVNAMGYKPTNSFTSTAAST